MVVTVNGKKEQVLTPSLHALVTKHCHERVKGVAVAVNDRVIPRTAWATAKLKENDSVLIIKATQGG
jgi:sulfur carrier protein